MYFRKTIFDTVKLWVGPICPKENSDHNTKAKQNIKEHIALTEDLVIDLTEAVDSKYIDDENARHIKERSKQALKDLKIIIDNSLNV